MMSKLNPSSVICEVMNEDGRMARLDDLIKFSKKHKIKIASIADIIAYRFKYEKLIYKVQSKNIILDNSLSVQFSIYKNKLNNFESFVLSKGKFKSNKPIAVRVLSKKINRNNLTKDKDVKNTINYLSKFKNFILVVINNEINKDKTDTDLTLRYYGIGAQIIKDFKVNNMILISRTKKKIIGLEGFGLKIKKQIII